MEFDRHGCIKEEPWNHVRDTPGTSGYKQVARGRGGRPRGKTQKGSTGPASKRSTKQGETLTQFLLQQGITAPGQRHSRGRRTVRRRRTEKKVVAESKMDELNDKVPFKTVKAEARNLVRDDFSVGNMVGENDDSSNSMEVDSDENGNENEEAYRYEKWGDATYDVVSNRSNEMVEMSEEEEADEMDDDNGGYGEEEEEEEEAGNMGGVVEFNDDESDGDERNRDEEEEEGSDDSIGSGDYSD